MAERAGSGPGSEGSFAAATRPCPFCPWLMEWMAWVGPGPRPGDHRSSCRLSHPTDHCHRQFPGSDLDPGWTGSLPHPRVIVQPHRLARKPCLSKRPRRRGRTAARRFEQGQPWLQSDGLALLETDMRSPPNPTRMASIRVLASSWCAGSASSCAQPAGPGLGEGVDVLLGLPCDLDAARPPTWCAASASAA